MFENLKKITIAGGYFEQPTMLNLFKDNQSLSIIYGRNGSGKTSIAKALRQLVGKDMEQETEVGCVQYSVSTDATIPDDKKDSVFIFDEDFVRDNVRTKGKGLDVTEGRFLCHDSAPELLHISRVLRNFVTNLYIAVIFVAFLFLVSK